MNGDGENFKAKIHYYLYIHTQINPSPITASAMCARGAKSPAAFIEIHFVNCLRPEIEA
jgi:hypothetical protein